MDKKYQVFISSTYADLVEERKKVLDVLLMADCIPAGMEAFVATDVEQFEVIKKVIDLCDYYVLIIGKRYGSIHPETGISYTEMEYDYAIGKDIPVLVFALDSGVDLPPEKCENDPDKIQKLEAFRSKAMTNRLASIWSSVVELTGKLAISIMKAKSEIARPGWQRGTDYDEASLRREIMTLQGANKELTEELGKANQTIQSLTMQNDVAFDNVPVSISYSYSFHNGVYSSQASDTVSTSLKEIFIILSTEMMDVSITESKMIDAIIEQLSFKGSSQYIYDSQLMKRILNQLKALGLVYSTWGKERKALYWGLTKKGEKVRNDMILIRSEKKET